MPSSKRSGLQGPRPQPLKVSRPTRPAGDPVVVYIRSPRVVHTSPQEFRTVVQQLTGKSTPPPVPLLLSPAPTDDGAGAASTPTKEDEAEDMLVLTLGRRESKAMAVAISSPARRAELSSSEWSSPGLGPLFPGPLS